MERCIEKDKKFQKVLRVVQILYILAGAIIAVMGVVHRSAYEALLALTTLLLLPGLWLVRKLMGIRGGWQLETYIYIFSLMGWTLGGAGRVYELVPYYDKLVHCLSGVFVSMLALALYRMMERRHSREGENPATACVFVFSASMAVAGLFELCEFALAPIMGRDLQNVAGTGVTDTMGDMLVCLIGTVVTVLLMLRSCRGKHDPFTDAAEALALQNPPKEKK